MTKAKAMMYSYLPVGFVNDLPEGFKEGAFVSVEFIGKGAFGWNFRCKTAEGAIAVFSEMDLIVL